MSDVDKSSLNTLLKGRNALVVEDEVIISFLIQDLLEEQGGGGRRLAHWQRCRRLGDCW